MYNIRAIYMYLYTIFQIQYQFNLIVKRTNFCLQLYIVCFFFLGLKSMFYIHYIGRKLNEYMYNNQYRTSSHCAIKEPREMVQSDVLHHMFSIAQLGVFYHMLNILIIICIYHNTFIFEDSF